MGVNPYDTGSWHVSRKQWPRDIASKRRKKGIRGFSFSEAISRATLTVGDLVVLIDGGLSPRRAEMDPAEEIRETKRQKEYIDMVGFVADSENGIPTRCPCGGTIIHEVRGKDDYDTLPGKRFFTCKNYKADGLHYRQPWVIGVEEHIERLSKRLEEVEMVIKWMPELTKQIERLEAEVKDLTVQVDNLNGEVYNLSVQQSTQSTSENTNQNFKTLIENQMYPFSLNSPDLDYYVSKYEKKGFTGAINYYRNIDRYLYTTRFNKYTITVLTNRSKSRFDF
ncbi:hypothetical protein IGI04_030855 [Brassica rapa subsp. trilocularis]|uniref:Zinc finger GRF-type domain-containing protein n=1 Tax=Brassica rapa subsp. trilocularis TaxID=1813537 RepID=A0ABQ7LRY2_BRACM|nr:hypothetical protein IGI04_030855 [Brassica rapa subsp. trilocularis]